MNGVFHREGLGWVDFNAWGDLAGDDVDVIFGVNG